MIPKIIHQTWKNRDVPDRWKEYQRSWIDNHPQWEYRLWTDDDNLALVERHYPQYLEFYRSLPYPILKVEFVKPLYLHQFGGLYVDLDFESLKPIDPLLDGYRIVVGQECDGAGKWISDHDYVINALLASTPRHPFWNALLSRTVPTFRPKRRLEIYEFYIFRMMIDRLDALCWEYRETNRDLVIYPSDLLYPSKCIQHDPRLRRRVALEKGAYAVHHYDDSWFSPSMKLIVGAQYFFYRLLLSFREMGRRRGGAALAGAAQRSCPPSRPLS